MWAVFLDRDGTVNEEVEYLDDPATDTLVAVKRVFFQGSERDLALTYRLDEESVVFITIHPLKEGQKERRIRSGRWLRK